MVSLFQRFLSETPVVKQASAPEIFTDDGEVFETLTKPQVLQEARCFKDKQINDRKCRVLLSRILYLINQGETFTDTETENLFFSITKLYQSENYDLRRMIYLTVREVRHGPSLYIITASLIKDMNAKVDLFRMNSLRLSPIIDPQYLLQSERYLKQSVIDKTDAVSCAALVAGIHLYPISADFVKKWANEISEKLNAKSPATHYHALILMREIKKQDKNSFLKILLNLTKEGTSSGIAAVQLIRFIRELILKTELDPQIEKFFADFLNKQLHKSSEMVVFEAAKTLCEFRSLPNKDLAPCVSVLSIYLSSSSTVTKFAALRIFNKLITNPARIPLIENITEMDTLLRENNRSLSAFAISILLKISKEDAVEQLLNQIQDFIGESSDEFKIDIISSIRPLSKKHPQKYKEILTFLQYCLKNEGKYEFKSVIVSSLEQLMTEIPDSREQALFILAEFIEDCQYSSLHIQVMNLLAREANNIHNHTKFIRLINNRIHLENSDIRAAAITTLGKFALSKHNLIPDLKVIIEEALGDTDSEVRSRAIFYLDEINAIEEQEMSELYTNPLSTDDIDYIEAFLEQNIGQLQNESDPAALDIANINDYIRSNNIKLSKKPDQRKKGPQESALDLDNKQAEQDSHKDSAAFQAYDKLFKENEHFRELGDLRLALDDKEVTDQGAEYIVRMRKLFLDDYIVLEYNVTNSMDGIALRNVTVDVEIDSEELKLMQTVSVNEIKSKESSNVYVTLAKHPDYRIITTKIQSFLKFEVAEFAGDGVTVATQYDDDYQLEDAQLSVCDYLQAMAIPVEKRFETVWKAFQGEEKIGSFQLDYKTLETAIKGLVKHFGMSVCDASDQITMQTKAHSLMLSGMYLGTVPVLVSALIGFQADRGCLMKLTCKARDPAVAESVVETIN